MSLFCILYQTCFLMIILAVPLLQCVLSYLPGLANSKNPSESEVLDIVIFCCSASVAAGALGGDWERFRSKEADNTNTSMKKRKKSETLDITDAEDAATRSVKARKDGASTL